MRKRPIFMEFDLPQDVRKVNDKDLATITGVPPLPFRKGTLQRHVGIEIEVEECGHQRFDLHPGINKYWIIERDPSLRGDTAQEFKTKHPCTTVDAIKALDAFFKMVATSRKQGYGEFSFNERTSIHVHVDVRDLSKEQIKAVIKLYSIFEKSFFDLIGRDRYHNVFCIPLMESQLLDGAGRGDEWWRLWEKYCAINVVPMTQYGTVEFRGMAGNDNQALIQSWMLYLTALVEYCSHTTIEKVESIIDTLKLESQYRMLADDLFGAELASHLTIFPEASDAAASLTKLF